MEIVKGIIACLGMTYIFCLLIYSVISIIKDLKNDFRTKQSENRTIHPE